VEAPANDLTWRAAGLDRITGRVVSIAADAQSVRLSTRWSPANSQSSVTTNEMWQLVDSRLELRVDITPSAGWDIVWPRVGLRFDLPGAVDSASWFGTGPRESYPDSRQAAIVGRFDAHIDDLNVRYARPQETGHRSAVRSLSLRRKGLPWLLLDAVQDTRGQLPGFSLARHTAQQVDAARHPHELPESSISYLYLDAAQHGLGSRACGPDVWPDSALRPSALTLRFSIRAEDDFTSH
jgi:beta-galactosidase